MTQPVNELREARAAALLKQAGLRGAFRLQALPGGANNKVFRLELPETSLLYKEYFHHADDPRDRLGHEWAFVSFAWHNGIRALPRPLAHDPAGHCALFEFIPGRKLEPDEVSRQHALAALRFFQQVNDFKRQEAAQALPPASEACFTLTEHCHCVERRLARLRAMTPTDDVDEAARRWIESDLTPAWSAVHDAALQRARRLRLAPDAVVSRDDRCLSPSDFGFHNALWTGEHTLKFIDFEYAGWDDPAKMVCDFFCQPERPAWREWFESFARGVARDLSAPDLHRERFHMLLPVYQVKWCCIMLNDFLPAGAGRRRFARGDDDRRKLAQLTKARQALSSLASAA